MLGIHCTHHYEYDLAQQILNKNVNNDIRTLTMINVFVSIIYRMWGPAR